MAFQTNSINVYKVLNCSISKPNDGHISEEPLTLKCGHTICTKCQPANVNIQDIECNNCNEMKKKGILDNEKIEPFEKVLNENLGSLFQMINQTFDEKMECFRNIGENIHTKIEFMKQEVDIRIETIKCELNQLREYFKKRLDNIESVMKNDMELKKNDIKQFEDDLERLKTSISNNQNLTKESLYKYQESLRRLKNMIEENRKNMPKVEIKVNETKMDTKLIGEIEFSFEDENECLNNIFTQMKDSKSETICMSNHEGISDFLFLPNGNLLLIDSPTSETTVAIYDPQFQLIKSVTSIGEHTWLYVWGVECNHKDEIYFADYSRNIIIKTDFDLNHLLTRKNEINPVEGNDVDNDDDDDSNDSGEFGDRNHDLYGPVGIFYKNGSIYVCNYNKPTIVKLNSKDLSLEATFNLTHNPWYIKIIGNVACVRDAALKAIYFYDINNNFSEIRKYEGHSGMLGSSDSHFFEYSINDGSFYCYDQNGNLKETFELKWLKDAWNFGYYNFLNGTIHLHKSKLYFAYRHSNKLLVPKCMIGNDDDIVWKDNYDGDDDIDTVS